MHVKGTRVELRYMIIFEQPSSEIPNPLSRVHLEFVVKRCIFLLYSTQTVLVQFQIHIVEKKETIFKHYILYTVTLYESLAPSECQILFPGYMRLKIFLEDIISNSVFLLGVYIF